MNGKGLAPKARLNFSLGQLSRKSSDKDIGAESAIQLVRDVPRTNALSRAFSAVLLRNLEYWGGAPGSRFEVAPLALMQ